MTTLGTETWGYAGVRLTEKGFLTDEWRSLDPAQAPMHSRARSDAAPHIIGGLYRIPVEHTDAGTERRGQPKFSHRYVDSDVRLEWAMQDAEARQALEDRIEEERGLLVNPLAEAVAPLSALLKSRKTYAARLRLLAAVVEHLISAE